MKELLFARIGHGSADQVEQRERFFRIAGVEQGGDHVLSGSEVFRIAGENLRRSSDARAGSPASR